MIKVHSYESMGTYDGPGLRLVVFLQGCPFKCLYCANPDTIPFEGGTATEIEDIVSRAVNQKAFFGKRGGVTFSGGEPTVQAKELIGLVRRLKEEGIHVCIDTNGGIWNSYVEELLSLVDLVLLDVKQFNDGRHTELTGRSNSQTHRTAQWLEEHGKPFWMRYCFNGKSPCIQRAIPRSSRQSLRLARYRPKRPSPWRAHRTTLFWNHQRGHLGNRH